MLWSSSMRKCWICRRARLHRKSFQRELYIGSRAWQIIIVVVPHHHSQRIAVERGQRGNVRLLANSAANNSIERHGMVAFDSEPLTAHLAEHAERVEHRLIDPIGGKRTESGEIRVVFKFEGPREGAFEIHAVPRGQIELARENGRRVTGEHRAVAVGELRSLAGGAAFGIGFADDDRLRLGFRIRGHDAKTGIDRAELVGNAHAHVAVDSGWRTLGVKRHEIERSALLAGGEIRAI